MAYCISLLPHFCPTEEELSDAAAVTWQGAPPMQAAHALTATRPSQQMLHSPPPTRLGIFNWSRLIHFLSLYALTPMVHPNIHIPINVFHFLFGLLPLRCSLALLFRLALLMRTLSLAHPGQPLLHRPISSISLFHICPPSTCSQCQWSTWVPMAPKSKRTSPIF